MSHEDLLGQLPGPARNWPLGQSPEFIGTNPWEVADAYHAVFGPVVLLWLPSPSILVQDADLISEIFETRTGDFYKDAPREALLPIITNTSCFIHNGDEWRWRRQAHPFSAQGFRQWLPTQVSGMRDVLRSTLAEWGRLDDLRGALERLTFDGFARMAVGTGLGDEVYGWFRVVCDEANQRMVPSVHVPTFMDLQFQNAKRHWFGTFDRFMNGEGPGADLVRTFLPTTEMDREDFRNEVANIFPAGLFSVTSSVMSTLLCVEQHAGVKAEVRAALDALGDEPTWEAIQGCVPLRHAMYEAMRLFPGAPFYTRNTARDRQIRFAGVDLPADTVLMVSATRLQQDERWWGADAGLYRPSRWAEFEGRSPIGSRFFFPFGLGDRECLGKYWGLAWAMVALSELLRRDWSLEVSEHKLAFYFGCMIHDGMKGTLRPS